MLLPMKVGRQRLLSHFHKIRCLEQRAELRARKITLIKIREGRGRNTGGRVGGLKGIRLALEMSGGGKAAGRTGCPPRPPPTAPGRVCTSRPEITAGEVGGTGPVWTGLAK